MRKGEQVPPRNAPGVALEQHDGVRVARLGGAGPARRIWPRGPTVRLTRRSLGVLLVMLAGVPGFANDVTEPVERLHRALLDAAAPGSTRAERQAALTPVVGDVFDFTTMSRVTVGAAWAEFDDAQRIALAEAFRDFATANYARSFDSSDGLAFATVGTRPDRADRVWVETELARPRGEPVRFDYLVQPGAERPAIVNVVVDGTLNELARRRAEFRGLLDQGGVDLLVTTLAAKSRE